MTKTLVQAVLLLLAIVVVPVHAGIQDVGMNAPSDPIARPSGISVPVAEESIAPVSLIVRGLFGLYHHVVGPTKGTHCPMVPSCSEYSRISVAQHGLAMGVIMSADRLHRCGHDLHLYPRLWSSSRGWSYDDQPK